MDGMTLPPTPVDPDNLTPAETAAIAQWTKDEALAQNLIGSRIPDSTTFMFGDTMTAAEMWDVVTREFTSKGAYAQTELRTKFLKLKCPRKGDVHAWLDSLHMKKEQLSAVGVTCRSPLLPRINSRPSDSRSHPVN
jgi:hypothetical protein